jgi:hypothetical protein
MEITEKDTFKLFINEIETQLTTREEILEFTDVEILHWAWLKSAIAPPSHYAGNELFKLLYSNRLENMRAEVSKKNPDHRAFNLGDVSLPYISANSTLGLLIEKTKLTYGPAIACFLLFYGNQRIRNLATSNPTMKRFDADPGFNYERTVAIQIALANENFSGLVGESRLSRMDEVVSILESKLNQTVKQSEQAKEHIATSINNFNSTIFRHAKRLRLSFKRRAAFYKAFTRKHHNLAVRSVEEVNSHVDEARGRLVTATQAFNDKFDLDESVSYWKNRKTSHSISKYTWLLLVFFSMGLTFVSMMGYYGLGAATGISKKINYETFLSQEVDPSADTTKSTSSKATTVDSLKNGPTTKPKDQQYLVAQTITDVAGAALLITLLGVLVRICLRQFNTHSHYAQDAAERITFTKTYLALLNEGKLKSDDDRRLILECLFRSSSPSSANDIVFSSPIELIMKGIADRKP